MPGCRLDGMIVGPSHGLSFALAYVSHEVIFPVRAAALWTSVVIAIMCALVSFERLLPSKHFWTAIACEDIQSLSSVMAVWMFDPAVSLER